MPALDPKTAYTLLGVLVDARTQSPLAGLTVEAHDFDSNGAGERLATTTTAADGRFALAFLQQDAGGRGEGAPEPYLVVRGPGAHVLHQTGWANLSGATRHDFQAVVVDSAAPAALGPRPRPGRAPGPTDPATQPGSATFHGSATRDLVVPRSPFFRGPFGRLFRELPPWIPPGANDGDRERALADLAGRMLETPAEAADGGRDNPGVPAAYTYFGQFVDHDITFDPTSSLTKLNDPDRLVNFRTPRFDLDNLYGEGPDDEPFLYDRTRPGHFLLGKGPNDREKDLPRNEQGTALVGDPRNDENIIVSQLQLAFLRFHNAVMDRVVADGLAGREAFHRAQQLVRWHYQWVVLHDFLPRICGPDMVRAVLGERKRTEVSVAHADGSPHAFDLRFYKPKEVPYMPVEFSAAAYRIGHSMVRETYDLNGVVRGRPVFLPPSQNPGPLDDLRGFRPLPGFWTLDWRRFVDLPGGPAAQLTRRIDTKLAHALGKIPAGPGVENPLALLNLRRGWRLELPSGQAVARAMGATPIPNAELGLPPEFAHEAPLWYYILKEAEVVTDGRHLGPVGGRIVAEVFVGLAKGDPNSYFNQDPTWTPATATSKGPLMAPLGSSFELRDLLRFAGLGGPPF